MVKEYMNSRFIEIISIFNKKSHYYRDIVDIISFF